MEEKLIIRGARVNNLKNITLELPRDKFVVITGVSGSGKSSLAFDTLFAEGQRRFAQSLSSYARQFLGRMSKPDVDSVEGIPPAIAIEQKVNTRNPRSTVATTTEIYDFLRILFARIGRTFSPVSGEEVRCSTPADVMSWIAGLDDSEDTLYILAPLDWDERSDKVELLLSLKQQGYSRLFAGDSALRIDDVLRNPSDFPSGASLLVDRMRRPFDTTRLSSSVSDAFERGNGRMSAVSNSSRRDFNTRFEMDSMVFVKPFEEMFSFNSPLGACPVCGGLGKVIGISEDLVIPDKTKSIYDGAIACWKGDKMGWFREHLIECAPRYGIDVFIPWCDLSEQQRDTVWNARSVEGDPGSLVGISEFFEMVESQRYKIQYKYMLGRFSGRTVCNSCHGSRLRHDALYVKVGGKNIHELMSMDVGSLISFFEKLELTEYESSVVSEPLSEILSRLRCISDVGLGYLTLNRACNTLSGGESQRINLVTALGSSLVGSMYILDEPSIGLHPRDTQKLIEVLRRLRDLGNTVIVVEHDEEIIRAADLLVDMGPGAGGEGGSIVFEGNAGGQLSQNFIDSSLTLQYLSGQRERYHRQKRSWVYSILLKGVREHNLKGGDVRIPLGVLTVVSGVSGSGKSSLVGDILYPALNRLLGGSGDLPGVFAGLEGNTDRISRVEYVDQNPIGKSSRSNALTYLKVYDEVRRLFASLPSAKAAGLTPQHFSFNAEGGRCPECQGDGIVKVEMQFMADVTMVCESCSGKRFKPEVLEVRYRDKNIYDILCMSVDEAIEFFSQGDEIARSVAAKLQPLVDVGLGYLKLGQSSSTLSGGESQRIKLAYFLSLGSDRPDQEKIMFIFDEPTTGLHFADVEKLLASFDVLLSRGHSLVVVEHNPDVIRSADWVIDLGPDAGDKGGEVVFEGTPEEMIASSHTFTADCLR